MEDEDIDDEQPSLKSPEPHKKIETIEESPDQYDMPMSQVLKGLKHQESCRPLVTRLIKSEEQHQVKNEIKMAVEKEQEEERPLADSPIMKKKSIMAEDEGYKPQIL